jgi:hypothetical protein
MVAACAAGDAQFGGDGGSGGQQVGTGGMAVGGSGQGGSTGPCAADCSAITTPDCNVAVCNADTGQCEVVADEDGASCDDGQFCTINDSCQNGECVGGPQNTCGMMPAACDLITCDEASQSCTSTPAGNGDPCTPTDLCQVDATCQNGLCVGTTNDCFFAPVPNSCHVAVCNPATGMCEAEPGNEGEGCVDPNELCTDGKTCSNGMCVGGGPKDCSALSVGCNEGVCDPTTGNCEAQPLMVGQMCSEAADDCNVGVCDMNGVCQPQPANEGMGCEDGNPCTAGETCTNGVCGGGTMISKTTYFSEAFADNSAGWTLDTEWQIGAATSSTGHTSSCGNGDPATDHTATADNGIAGAAIGGNVSTSLHSYYYLTSPAIDVSAVNGPLWLGFWRWLNSDYTRYMNNRVEVFDGAQWQVLWESGPPPNVEDGAWTQQAFDIGPYKNNQLQVRFGYEVGSGGVYTCSGWNVDDVEISNVVCP